MTRIWQLTAQVVFPTEMPGLELVDGVPRMPEQLVPRSRIPTVSRTLGNAEVFIRKSDATEIGPGATLDFRSEIADLILRLRTDTSDVHEAIDEAGPYLERSLESMSFQMQCSLPTIRLEVIDLAGSPQVGEMREVWISSGYATPTLRPTSVPMQSLVGRLVPDLTVDLDQADTRAHSALDWYMKAAAAQYEVDHFMFLWIATEILAVQSGFSVSEPYRGPACNHVIANCPECDAETTKPVQGASMQRYLTEGFDMEPASAKKMWKVRQMMHGQYAIDSAIMKDLPDLSQRLRAVVVTALKIRLGMPHNEPPFAKPTGLSISPFMGVGGERAVTQRDLDPISLAGETSSSSPSR